MGLTCQAGEADASRQACRRRPVSRPYAARSKTFCAIALPGGLWLEQSRRRGFPAAARGRRALTQSRGHRWPETVAGRWLRTERIGLSAETAGRSTPAAFAAYAG